MRPAVTRYINGQHHKVNGWLADFSARFIAELAAYLEQENIHGAAVEIGAHHGRLFILLHLASTAAQDLVIDVFEDQHLNVDESGKGDRAILLRNLERCGGAADRVQIMQRSSLEVTPEDILAAVGQPALFSIDGGHTAECAINDLRLADATLAEQGIAILDDVFNEFWPEVAVGTLRFFADPATRLRPFAISAGKVYLCRPGKQAFFHTAIYSRFSRRYVDKSAHMLDSPVLVVGIRDGRRSRARRLAWGIVESPLGRWLGLRRWLPPKFSAPA